MKVKIQEEGSSKFPERGVMYVLQKDHWSWQAGDLLLTTDFRVINLSKPDSVEIDRHDLPPVRKLPSGTIVTLTQE